MVGTKNLTMEKKEIKTIAKILQGPKSKRPFIYKDKKHI